MAALCQRLGDERGDALAHPRSDYVHQHTRVGMLGTNEEPRVAALCQRLGDERGDAQRIQVAIMCTSLPT